MKNLRVTIILIFFWFLTLNVQSQENWKFLSKPVSGLKDLFFTDAKTGYAVGQDVILKTTNGGDTWRNLEFGSDENDYKIKYHLTPFSAVHFVNDKTGFVAGGKLILKTDNAGKSWTRTEIKDASHITDIFFVDEEVGYAVGWSGQILKTIDAGKTWNVQQISSKVDLEGICCTSPKVCWAVGKKGTILKTTSGGGDQWGSIEWFPQNSGYDDRLRKVQFLDAKSGYIIGYGKLLKTVDGGTTWSASDMGYMNTNFFITEDEEVYICHFNGLRKTKDAGKTHETITIETKNEIHSVFLVDSETGFAVGDDGVFKMERGAIQITPAGELKTESPVSKTDALSPKLAPTGKRVALVIGISAYPTAPLKNTLNDAMDMTATLKEKGFEVISLYNPKTKSEIRDAVIQFNKSLYNQPSGVGLLFYSGHGIQVDGANYMVPAMAKLELKADVEDQCMNMDYVLRAMEENGNMLNVIILDACRNNPFRSFSRSAEKGLSMANAPKGSYLVYSTKPGSIASDGTGRNGLFTSKLLKYINTPGLNIEQLFKNVANEVSKESGDSQRPWMNFDYTGDFFFNKN